MTINNLIANPNMVDPVQRYGQGFKLGAGMADVQSQRMQNVQDMNIRERKMDMLAREQQMKEQDELRSRLDKYGQDIAPVVKEIMDMPESQRSAAYQSKVSAIREIAVSNGLDPSKSVSPVWDNDKATALIQRSYQEPDRGFSTIDPSKYTSESVAKYEKSGKRGDLVAVEKKDGVSQTVNVGGVDKATETYGKGIGEQASKRNQYAQSAMKQKSQLEAIALAIEEGARTGKMEETILEARSFLQTIGVDTGDLSGQELIRKTSNEMALRLRNPESGLGLTGNTSNKDLDFLKASVVGLSRTEKGNIEMIKLMNKYNDLAIDVAAEQNRIIMRNGGTVPIDLDSRIMDYVNNYDFFTKEEKTKIDKALKGKKTEDYSGMSDDEIRELEELRSQQNAQ